MRIGLALNCEIAEWCRFARKNYFYPDMPKNFQTSQYDEPIAFDGWMDVELPDGETCPRRDRARPHGGGHRQVAARRRRHRPHPRRRPLAGRLQPGRHPADRDRHQADRGHRRAGARRWPRRTSPQLRDLLLGARRLRRPHGAGLAALRRQPVAAPRRGSGDARHPHRDQERQLAALGRARGPLRDRPARRGARRRAARSSRRPGTGTRTPGSPPRAGEKSDAEDYRYFPEPDLVPVAPSREWVEELRATLPEPPRVRRRRGCRPSGASPTWRCATSSAPARWTWSRRPSPPAPPRPRPASGGSARWPAAPTSAASTSPSSAVTPADVARVQALVDDGQDQRQARPPGPRRRARRRGLPGRGRRARAVSRSSPTTARSPAAVDRAIAANPDVADKIRDGKVAAAGALIGAVMKEMRGQADAGRVRELILAKLS